MKKRLLALLCALAAALSLSGGALAAVSDSSRLETIRALGIMVGDEKGDMALNRSVTRAEFVKMMTAASVYKDTVGSGYGSSLFKDVKTGYWACEYIKLGVEQGWFNGYVDGTFRPDNTITLEEACTALLRLLGYDSSNLAGSFPTAQLSKASGIGLLDDMTLRQGDLLTRRDCVTLFYNLLTVETSSGQVYGAGLGCTIANGEVDYGSLVSTDLKGPYVAYKGTVELPFDAAGAAVYRDGGASSLSAVKQYDVYYYNTNLRTVWVYSDRAVGTLSAVSPNRVSPTSATVAGKTYSIGTSTAAYQLSSQGSFAEGDTVTLLLGMSGEVVEVLSAAESQGTFYGVVVGSVKAASSSTTASSSSTSVQVETQVTCTDGSVRTFYHTGGAVTAGKAVCVVVSNTGTQIRQLGKKAVAGTVNAAGTKLGDYRFADGVEILDSDDEGAAVRIYPSRLAGVKLTTDDVRFYTLDANGDIDHLLLNDVTGDAAEYVYVTSAKNSSSGLTVSGTYTYLANGESRTISGAKTYNVAAGGAVLVYEDGSLKSIQQLSSARLTDLNDLYAMSGDRKYDLSEDIQVLLQSETEVYPTTLSEVNAEEYTLRGWYDDNAGRAAGGRIRILVATRRE